MSYSQYYAMNSEMDYDEAVAQLHAEGLERTQENIHARKAAIFEARRQDAEDRALAALEAKGLEPTPENMSMQRDEHRRIAITPRPWTPSGPAETR